MLFTLCIPGVALVFGENDRIHLTEKEAAEARAGIPPTAKKLAQLVIPKAEFREATARDAIAWLERKSVELDTTETDTARKGVPIVFDLQSQSSGDVAKILDSKITLSLTNIPVGEALRYVTKLVGLKMQVQPAYVILSGPEMKFVTCEYTVPAGFPAHNTVQELLESAGMEFPDGASAQVTAGGGKLIIRNTKENLAVLDWGNLGLDAVISAGPLVESADLKQLVGKQVALVTRKPPQHADGVTIGTGFLAIGEVPVGFVTSKDERKIFHAVLLRYDKTSVTLGSLPDAKKAAPQTLAMENGTPEVVQGREPADYEETVYRIQVESIKPLARE